MTTNFPTVFLVLTVIYFLAFFWAKGLIKALGGVKNGYAREDYVAFVGFFTVIASLLLMLAFIAFSALDDSKAEIAQEKYELVYQKATQEENEETSLKPIRRTFSFTFLMLALMVTSAMFWSRK